MSTRKLSAAARILQAHDRLLASVRIAPGAPAGVTEALIRRGDFIEASVLAGLIGHLAGRVSDGNPLSSTAIAEIVEAMCGNGVQEADRLIASATTKEVAR